MIRKSWVLLENLLFLSYKTLKLWRLILCDVVNIVLNICIYTPINMGDIWVNVLKFFFKYDEKMHKNGTKSNVNLRNCVR